MSGLGALPRPRSDLRSRSYVHSHAAAVASGLATLGVLDRLLHRDVSKLAILTAAWLHFVAVAPAITARQTIGISTSQCRVLPVRFSGARPRTAHSLASRGGCGVYKRVSHCTGACSCRLLPNMSSTRRHSPADVLLLFCTARQRLSRAVPCST